MREYELTVLIHPDLEMNIEPATEKVKKVLEDAGAKITKEASEGKKRLAYKIKGQDFAIYYYFEAELPTAAPARISSVLNITDEVMRYLLVSKDEKKAKAEEKQKARKKVNEEENNEEE
jgi:small subunit ribosomal protein S6